MFYIKAAFGVPRCPYHCYEGRRVALFVVVATEYGAAIHWGRFLPERDGPAINSVPAGAAAPATGWALSPTVSLWHRYEGTAVHHERGLRASCVSLFGSNLTTPEGCLEASSLTELWSGALDKPSSLNL